MAYTEFTATGEELREWAHRPGARWPCSELARLDCVTVELDSDGNLVDLVTEPADRDIPANERGAWIADTRA